MFGKMEKKTERTVHSIIVFDPNEQTDIYTDYTISAKVSSL
jgi:hypothetical protein